MALKVQSLPIELNYLNNQIQDVGTQNKTLYFMINQFLEQSSIGNQNQRNLSKQASTIIEGEGNLSEKWFSLRNMLEKERSYHAEQFDEYSQWFTTPEGKRFIEKDIRHMQSIEIKGLGKPNYVSTLSLGQEEINAMTQRLQGSKFGKHINVMMGESSEFLIQGQKQTSKIYTGQITIPGMNSAFKFQFFEPSDFGFIANPTSSVGSLKSSGESLYATGKRFIHDVSRDGQVMFSDSFQSLQMNLLDQMNLAIDELRNNPHLQNNPHALEAELTHIFDKYNQTVLSQQHYGGSAAEMQNVSGIQRNSLAKVVSQQEATAVVPAFARNKSAFMPGSSTLYEAMATQGLSFPLSSGQVGNTVEHVMGDVLLAPKGLSSNLAFDPNYPFPSYREPHKMLNIPTPIGSLLSQPPVIPGTNLPRVVDVLPGAYQEGAQEFTKQNFKPKGIQTVVTFLGNINTEAQPVQIDLSKLAEIYPDKTKQELESMALSLKSEFSGSNLYLPDGTILAKDTLAKDAGVGYMRSEKIKLTGPGGQGSHQIGGSLAALLEGKTSTFRLGNEDIEFAVTGLRESKGNMKNALKLKSFSGTELQKQQMESYLQTFGFPLPQGEYLGLDEQGRQVSSSNRANVVSYVNVASMGDESLDLRLFQTTEQAMRDGRAVNQINKFTGGALNKARVSANYVTPKQFEAITGITNELVESGMPATRLASAVERTYYQGGAAKLSISKILDDLLERNVIKADSVEGEVASAFKNMSVEDLLSLAHGEESKGLRSMSLSDEARALIKQMPASNQAQASIAQKGTSAEFKLGVLALHASILGGNTQATNTETVQKWIQNIYAPHTAWGKQIGFSDEMDVFTSWGKQASSVKVGKQQVLNELQELSSIMLAHRSVFGADKAKDLAELMLKSEAEILATLSFGITDEGTLLGMGQKATLEPRYFDLVKKQPYLTTRSPGWISPMEEITSRMTNYIPAIEEINKVLSGYRADNVIDLKDFNKTELTSKMSATIDLGFSSEQLGRIEDTIEEMYGAEKYSAFKGQIYMPSEEHLTAMGKMKGGLSLEKDKPIRQVYSDFLHKISEGQRTNASEKDFARMFASFHDDMQNFQKIQLMGESGGGAHGLMRGPVHGSTVSYNLGYSGDLQEALGLIPDSEGRYKSKFYQTQRQSYYQNVLEQGSGRQVFLSEAAANAQFNEAINFYKQEMAGGKLDHSSGQTLISELENNLERLRQGHGVGSLVGRDPGINTGSLTGATLYMDRASNYALDAEAISIPQQLAKMSINGKDMIEINYSILNELAGDHDGDRIKVFALSRRNSEQVSQYLTQSGVEGELRAARTAAIKNRMVSSVKDQSIEFKNLKFGGNVPQLTAEQIVANEARAQASVKTVVPRISNAFSEMKFALSLSDVSPESLDVGFNFLYSGEQVPISGKHFVEQTEFGDQLVSRFSKIRKDFLDPDKYEDAVKNMMGLLGSDAEGNLLSDMTIQIEHRGKNYETKVSYQQIQDDLIRAGKLLHSNEKNVEILKQLRSKADLEGMSQDQLMGMYRQLGENLEGVHFRASELENLFDHTPKASGAKAASQALTQINNQTIQEGIEKGVQGSKILSKIAPKNLAIAGGLLAAAGAGLGMMMSPTFVNKREHYIDPDYLFPEEFDKLDPSLHSKGLITPSAVVADRGMNAQIHLPPGTRIPENLAGRLAMMGGNTVSSLTINDHRMSLDANKIDKIKREII